MEANDVLCCAIHERVKHYADAERAVLDDPTPEVPWYEMTQAPRRGEGQEETAEGGSQDSVDYMMAALASDFSAPMEGVDQVIAAFEGDLDRMDASGYYS